MDKGLWGQMAFFLSWEENKLKFLSLLIYFLNTP